MMTKQVRYYYTDPLAAAWQVKHHNIKLELIIYDIDTEETTHNLFSGDFFDWPKINLDTERFGVRYYIHSDELLQPQEDDQIMVTENLLGYINLPSKNNNFKVPMIHIAWTNEMREYNGQPIKERNGISFISPEREEVKNEL